MSRPPKPKHQSPIQAAVSSWLDSLPPTLMNALVDRLRNTHIKDDNDIRQLLLSCAPKRWVVYEPMVLLPSGSFSGQPWPVLFSSLTGAQRVSLWTGILGRLSPSNSRPPLTHLAINEGIPLHLAESPDRPRRKAAGAADENENLLRAPTNLHPLHGDFGPLPSPSSPEKLAADLTTADLSAALWVSTTQNGLVQTWAPAHTMFSRGNIKEKARLLSFHSPPSASASPLPSSSSSSSASSPHRFLPPHLAYQRRRATIKPEHTTTTPSRQGTAAAAAGAAEKWAIDLYAGIGYFAFSYARLGMRVLCWEVSPWSVEGLRRGAERNGFSVRVITTTTITTPSFSSYRSSSPAETDSVEIWATTAEQIVVFFEDNALAAGRIAAARRRGWVGDVVHVNCGFLPSSEGVWRDALGMMAGRGWLHLHENVGVGDIEARKGEVQGLFDGWIEAEGEEQEEEEEDKGAKEGVEAEVEHVELVKTYAPGVWHCVFDVFINKRSSAVQ
ncbi:hypothetical protein N658DRAFT_495938 [Parathielavia hyrcaniae]|uniref:tRNA wybutosine-synthesizing protein 2 n=1 Tax=Parathielavia hyrcaniae TaxID=113614 RepID=A0AAN6Q377_9PEZI|nr:hypothetical protein N658DRAFT_495938 [Parathielavia hyrcaniae]